MKKTLLVLSVLSAAIAQSPDPERLAAALQERALLDNVSRLSTDQKILMYQKLREAKPENLRYHNLLATAYLQKMRETTDPAFLASASRVIDEVLAADSANYEALRIQNEIHLENHDFKKAAASSRALTRIAPEDPWNFGTLGDALMETGDYNGAAEAYQKMMNLRPDLASYNRAAWYRYVAGDAAGAIEVMKLAVASGSRSPEHVAWCLVELGNLYLRTNNTRDAAASFARATKLLPNYHPALAGVGKTLAVTGDLIGAIQAYSLAWSATPLPEYAAALHDLYRKTGNEAEAKKQLAMLDMLDRMGQAAKEKGNRSLANAYSNAGYKLDRALALAKAEIDIRQDVFSWDALAWALYKNARYEEAAEAAAKALSMGTPEAQFYYHAGMIAAALGKKDEALKHLQRALELNPSFDLTHAQVARQKLEELS